MPDEDPWHFPPDLIDLLIEVLPLLFRSKVGLLDFFRGCGVASSALSDLSDRVAASPKTISKYEILRTVLNRVNGAGDRTLRQRREIIKRVVEFEDFSLCWPDDQFKAKGQVSDVRRVVNVRDSFTRMQQAAERRRDEAAAERRRAAEARQRQRAEREAIRGRLAGLSAMPNPQQRGLALERVLNDLFTLDGDRTQITALCMAIDRPGPEICPGVAQRPVGVAVELEAGHRGRVAAR
jgi:restriction system protein